MAAGTKRETQSDRSKKMLVVWGAARPFSSTKAEGKGRSQPTNTTLDAVRRIPERVRHANLLFERMLAGLGGRFSPNEERY